MRDKLLPLGTRVSWDRELRPVDYFDQEGDGDTICYEAVGVEPRREGIITGRRIQYDYLQQKVYGQKERIKGSGKPYYLCAYDLRHSAVKVPDDAIRVVGAELGRNT